MSAHEDEFCDEQELQQLIDQVSKSFQALDDVTLPESLKSKNLLPLLSEVEQDSVVEEDQTGNVVNFEALPKKGMSRKRMRQMASVAAAFVCIVGIWYTYSRGGVSTNSSSGMTADFSSSSMASATGAESEEGQRLDSDAVPEAAPNQVSNGAPLLSTSPAMMPEEQASDYTAVRQAMGDTQTSQEKSFPDSGFYKAEGGSSKTNPQTADTVGPMLTNQAPVVRPDSSPQQTVLCQDKNYRYHLYSDAQGSTEVQIVDASNEQVVSTIPLEEEDTLYEAYLVEDCLVLVESGDWNELEMESQLSDPISAYTQTLFVQYNQDLSETMQEDAVDSSDDNESSVLEGQAASTAVVYDVANPSSPKVRRRFQQTGTYLDSQVCDGTLYLVSSDEKSGDARADDTQLAQLIPSTYDSVGHDVRPMRSEDITLSSQIDTATYAVVTALEVSDDQAPATTKAVLGMDDKSTVCFETEELYLMGMVTDSNGSGTQLYAFECLEQGLELTGSTQVMGTIPHSDFLNWHDGILYVVTTSKDTGYSLYLFEKSLVLVGSIENVSVTGDSVQAQFEEDTVTLTGDNGETISILCSDPANPVLQDIQN